MNSSLVTHIMPKIVRYDDNGFLLTTDCFNGTCHVSHNQIASIYHVNAGDLSICGKKDGSNIVPLNNDEIEIVKSRGWIYKFCPDPVVFWLDELELHQKQMEQINIKKRDYLQLTYKQIQQMIHIFKTKYSIYNDIKLNSKKVELIDELIKMENKTKLHFIYSPPPNTENKTANNYNEWIYFLDCECWINYYTETCNCIRCCQKSYNSITPKINKHCYGCYCKNCNCQNNVKFNLHDNNICLPSKLCSIYDENNKCTSCQNIDQ